MVARKSSMRFQFILIFLYLTFAVSTLPAYSLEVVAGGTTVAGTVGEKHWITFQNRSAAASNGDITTRLLIYGQLGTEENIMTALRRGRVQYVNMSAAVTTTIVPELALLYIPFLFDDYDEADFVFDNYLFHTYGELLEKEDIHLVAWSETGFSHIYGIRPILIPADTHNVRFRVSSSEAARLFGEALGTDIIPLGFTDIVSGLQTGLIEAGDAALNLYVQWGISDEAHHLTLTGHLFGTSIIASRKSWWDGLSARQRDILTQAYPSAEESRNWTRKEVEQDLVAAKDKGITIHRISTKQRQMWKDTTANVAGRMIETIGGQAQAIHALILEAKHKYAIQKNAP